MREFCLLLAPGIWSLRNDVVRGSRFFYLRVFLYAGLIIAFIALITKLLGAGMARLQGLSPDVFNVLVIKGYALVFIIIFFVQIVNGFVISLNVYYRARELEVLLMSPVKRTAFFFSKLLVTHVKASWMLAVFGIPLLVSPGLLYHAALFYYPLALLLFVVFSSIPVNIGIGAAVVMSRTFHARRMRRTLLWAGIGAAVLTVTLLRLFRPERFVNPELFANLTLFINELRAPSFVLLPNRWLSESVFALLGRLGSADTVIFVSLLFLTSYVTGFLLHVLFRRYYLEGWEVIQGGDGLDAANPGMSRGGSSWLGRSLARVTGPLFSVWGRQKEALLQRYFLYQLRDARNLQQMLVLASLIGVYLFSVASVPLNWIGYTVHLRYTSSFFNLGLILIIIAALCSRILYPAFSSERASLWIVKTCPVTTKSYIRTTFVFFLVPVLTAGQVLTICSSLLIGAERSFIALECVTVTLVSFSLVAMGMFFGASGMRRLTVESAVEGKQGSTLYMIVSVILIMLVLAVEIVPAFLYFLKESTQTMFTRKAWVSIGAVLLIQLIVNGVVTILSLRQSVRALDRVQV